MTKGEMIASIQIALKWADENSLEALEWMRFVIADYGFRTVSGWKWSDVKRFQRLSKDDLMDLMTRIVECMYLREDAYDSHRG